MDDEEFQKAQRLIKYAVFKCIKDNMINLEIVPIVFLSSSLIYFLAEYQKSYELPMARNHLKFKVDELINELDATDWVIEANLLDKDLTLEEFLKDMEDRMKKVLDIK